MSGSFNYKKWAKQELKIVKDIIDRLVTGY